jgi:hypothetical protein
MAGCMSQISTMGLREAHQDRAADSRCRRDSDERFLGTRRQARETRRSEVDELASSVSCCSASDVVLSDASRCRLCGRLSELAKAREMPKSRCRFLTISQLRSSFEVMKASDADERTISYELLILKNFRRSR